MTKVRSDALDTVFLHLTLWSLIYALYSPVRLMFELCRSPAQLPLETKI